MTFPLPVMSFVGVGPPIENLTYRETKTNTASLPASWTGCDVGAANNDRWVVVYIGASGSSINANSFASVTIGGVSADIVATAGGGGCCGVIAVAQVPTGTGITIANTLTGGSGARSMISIWTFTKASDSIVYNGATDTIESDGISETITEYADGAMFGGISERSGSGITRNYVWSSFTEDYNAKFGSYDTYGSAHASGTADGSHTETVTGRGPDDYCLVLASIR